MTDKRFTWDDGDVVLLRRRKTEGGPGSGHFGHSGRPGEVGGSEPAEGHEGFFVFQDTDSGTVRAEIALSATTLQRGQTTDDERASVRAYKGIAYENINQQCRDIPEHEWSNDVATRVKDIDAVMAKSEIVADCVLWRAIGTRLTTKIRDLLASGGVFRDDGYVSASVSKKFAEGFRSSGTVCRILVPAGTKGFSYTAAAGTGMTYDQEGEIILGRGNVFKPVSIDMMKDANGYEQRVITLRIVKKNQSDTAWFDDVMKTEGGQGSGHFGHAGRPGEVGGSAPSGSIPESPISSTVRSNHFNRIELLADRTGKTVEEYEKDQAQKFKKHLDDSRVGVRVSGLVLKRICESGRFKSQFETKTSRGLLDEDYRREAEANLGYDSSSTAPSMRPIYGFISKTGEGPPKGYLDNYGNITVILKKDVNQRTTFTDGDSLAYLHDKTLMPSPMTNPSVYSSVYLYDDFDFRDDIERTADNIADGGPDGKDYMYWEAQIHGGVKLSDIDYVIIPPHAPSYEDIDVVKKVCDHYGLKWRTGNG